MAVRFVEYYADLINPPAYLDALDTVNYAGRTCYQSHSSLTDGWVKKEEFISNLIKNGHESVLEHVSYSMEVLIDRGLLAEWTRHRIGSAYSVESTRYVNYSNREVECILPSRIDGDDRIRMMDAIEDSIQAYQEMVAAGVKPQVARAVLPQALAVHMVATHNIRQWRHILKERMVNTHAHPDIRRVMALCYDKLMAYAEVFFKDIVKPLDI